MSNCSNETYARLASLKCVRTYWTCPANEAILAVVGVHLALGYMPVTGCESSHLRSSIQSSPCLRERLSLGIHRSRKFDSGSHRLSRPGRASICVSSPFYNNMQRIDIDKTCCIHTEFIATYDLARGP